jgi:hypothetical protein
MALVETKKGAVSLAETFGAAKKRSGSVRKRFLGAGKGWPSRCRDERDAGKNYLRLGEWILIIFSRASRPHSN